jgi:hypothetical protein
MSDALFVVSGLNPANNTKWEVLRRFYQFVLLRECIVKRLPGLYVPPLPTKLTRETSIKK